MNPVELDRRTLRLRPLAQRKNRVVIERDRVVPEAAPGSLTESALGVLAETVERVRAARQAGRPVVLAFGAHAIKNGLAPVLIRLIEQGWVTHLATNGAGIVHDWEFAYQGATGEDVRANMAAGQFGLWEETGFYINLALLAGAFQGLGYGGSVGAFIQNEGVQVPSAASLQALVEGEAGTRPDRSAAAADLLHAIREFGLAAGWTSVPHPHKAFSVQAAALRAGVRFTGHPMIGQDIIYCHPLCSGAAVGRTAERDFLIFADTISRIGGGVYLSVGSAVMSPMVFEKAFSMAQNLHLQKAGRPIEGHFIVAVDLTPLSWDWQTEGEPPADNPAYYLRFCKTFSRVGGSMRYACGNNRDFLLALCQALGGG